MNLILLIRSLFLTSLFILMTAILSLIGLGLNLLFSNKEMDSWIAQKWGAWTCYLFNVEVVEHHIENKLKSGGLYLFNHTSFFDIFVMQSSIFNLRFGSKIELFKIPLLGQVMKRYGVLPIARKNIDEVIRVYKETEGRIQSGDIFALAPEGTRQLTEKLGTFKSGPFVLAINSKATIVPVLIKGALEVWPPHEILAQKRNWKNQVHLYYLEPIQTDNLVASDKNRLVEKVRNTMLLKWEEVQAR